jgi:hemolysin III
MTGCSAFLSHSTTDDHAMAADGFSVQEERLNAATHAAGALLSVVGMVWLIVRAGSTGQSGSVAVSTVYGAALVLLYLFSALHHAVSHPRTKQIFLALDHCGIYLLIAGTYTPFMLLMPAGQGWLLLSFVWSVAAVGIALQMGSFIAGRSNDYERFAFVLYLAMGWGPLFWVSDDVMNKLAPVGFALLLAGGIAYSAGVIFYLWKTLFHNHAIWHLFVIAGSVLQFFSILFYVVPANH